MIERRIPSWLRVAAAALIFIAFAPEASFAVGDPPPPPPNEVLQQRAAAAERIRALMGRPKPAHDDIGADSGGEIKRLRERNEELENENACLRRENLALRTEIDELKARLPTVPPSADDGLDVPEFLRRTAP